MAIQIDRVDLADLANPKELAAAVFKQSGLSEFPGKHIDELAFGCGITSIEPIKTAGFEGALITDDAKSDGVILANNQNGPERRRFTIAHELGHFLNPWHKPPVGGFQCAARDMLSANAGNGPVGIETQANQFAAELLMPKPLFNAAFRRAGGELTTQVLKKIAADAGVSALATGRRLADLRGDCAIVLSQNGAVTQIYRGSDFPYLTLASGDPIPRGSVTRKFLAEAGTHSEIEEIEVDVWTTSTTKHRLQFLEQVLTQSNGYRLTLLAIDESECEDEDDESARSRSEWNPRFRK